MTICAIFTLDRYSSIETAPLCKILEHRTIMHGDIAFQRIGGYIKCCHECSLGVYLVIDNYLYVPSDALPLYNILNRTIGYGDIAFQRFEDIESVVTNVVVLVLGECQISMATYLRGYLPSCKVILQYIWNWQRYATSKSSRSAKLIHRQTDRQIHVDTHTPSIQ